MIAFDGEAPPIKSLNPADKQKHIQNAYFRNKNFPFHF